MKLNEQEEKVRNNYNAMKEIWRKDDEWHNYTHSQINAAIDEWIKPLISKDKILLNAGSADTFYDFDCLIYDCDIAESKLVNSKHPIIANIQDLPLSDSSIDLIICVGSVINYCDATKAIAEFSRVMRPNSYLLLEFERSQSGEFLFSSKHGKDVFSTQYQYNHQVHKLWMYSEKHIARTLSSYGLQIVKKGRFHLLSALISKFKTENCSAQFAKFDKFLKPLSACMAHNAIFLIKK